MSLGHVKMIKWFPLLFSGLFLLFAIIYSIDRGSKVYVVDDESDLFAMVNDSIPSSLYVEDLVWGMVSIDDSETVIDFYDFISSLPLTDEEGPISEEAQKLQGSIYFTSGNAMSFILGDYVYLNGIAYGNRLDRIELKRYTNYLRKQLYNRDNLTALINPQNKLQLRMGQTRKNLAIDQKKKLKEIILNADFLDYQANTPQQIQNKGQVIGQIEFYVGEKARIPQVYIVVYEGGLCMVYDSFTSQSGSIMQFILEADRLVGFIEGVEIGRTK